MNGTECICFKINNSQLMLIKCCKNKEVIVKKPRMVLNVPHLMATDSLVSGK